MKVLITDDMYTNRLRIKMLLKNMGHTCEEAVDGDDAIVKLQSNDYDLILMDLEMPKRNGFETCQYIREEMNGAKKDTPVIIISSHGSLSFFRNYDRYGYNGILTKPFTEEKLQMVLDKIMETEK